MPIEFERKVARMGDSLRVVIPKEIAKALKIEAGDIMVVTLSGRGVLLKKKSKGFL